MGSILDLGPEGLQYSWTNDISDSIRIDPWFYAPFFLKYDDLIRSQLKKYKGSKIFQIGDVGNVEYGHMPLEDYVDSSSGHPFIRVTNLKGDLIIDDTDLKFIRKDSVKKESHFLKKNDILVVQNGFSTGKTGYVSKKYRNFVYPSFVLKIDEIDKCVDPAYLAAYLNSKIGQLQIRRGISVASVHPNTTKRNIEEIEVFLPPLKYQKAFGNIVRSGESCREISEQILIKAKNILGKELCLPKVNDENNVAWFINPSTDLLFNRLTAQNYNPRYMENSRNIASRINTVSLGEIIGNSGKDISGGATPKGASYYPNGVPFLRVQNILRNHIDLSNAVFINKETHNEMERSQVKAYDVIMTITGYPGNAACITPDILPVNMNQHSVRFSIKKDKADPFYISAFLNTEYGYLQVKQRAAGATRDALDYNGVKSIMIPLIKLEKQKAIGELFRQYSDLLRKSKTKIIQSKTYIEAMINGNLDIEQWLDNQDRN